MLVVLKNRWGTESPRTSHERVQRQPYWQSLPDPELLYSADLVIYDTAKNVFTIMRGSDPPEVLKVSGQRSGLRYRDD